MHNTSVNTMATYMTRQDSSDDLMFTSIVKSTEASLATFLEMNHDAATSASTCVS